VLGFEIGVRPELSDSRKAVSLCAFQGAADSGRYRIVDTMADASPPATATIIKLLVARNSVAVGAHF
jgi:hypothetical protein